MSTPYSNLVGEAQPAILARVAIHEGETSHYERDDATGQVHVSVVTHGTGQELTALLHSGGGGGLGLWCIPPVGAEVLLLFPDGLFEGDPVLFGGGGAPSDLTGSTIIIVPPPGGKLLVHRPGAPAKRVASVEDIEVMRNELFNHQHTYLAPGSPPAPALTTGNTTLSEPVGLKAFESE